MGAREYKQLSCRDFGADCDFLVRAQSEEEVITLATEHACRIHSKCQIPSDPSKIRGLIKSVWL
jgi:predicted small metal-binding protein